MSHALRPALTFAACAAILSLSACSSATTADSTASPESASSEATAGSPSEATAGSPADQDASIIPDEARTNVSNLSVGQCVQKPADPSAPLTTVDCSSPHWGEVFFVAPIEDFDAARLRDAQRQGFRGLHPRIRRLRGNPLRRVVPGHDLVLPELEQLGQRRPHHRLRRRAADGGLPESVRKEHRHVIRDFLAEVAVRLMPGRRVFTVRLFSCYSG